MINWPGIIKHLGDAELVYISNQAEWDNDIDLHNFEYDEADILIDSLGYTYALNMRENKRAIPDSLGEVMELKDVLGLIKAHAAQKGSCCVAKLYAPSIIEAFKIVESLNED